MGPEGSGMDNLMSAIAFAEHGELDTARELAGRGKRVLLAVKENRIDAGAFSYAANICKRIGAALDVMHVSTAGIMSPLLEQCLCDLKGKGVSVRLIKKSGCMKEQIIDYTAATREIVFAVTGEAEHIDVECRGKGKRLSEAWHRLRCPLVVVGENA